MKTKHLNRFSPLLLSKGISLKNRVVVPPMASGSATAAGHVTDATLSHYSKLAESGAGLVIVEYSFVHPSGRSEENQLAVSSPSQLPGLKLLAETIRARGALPGIQLVHSGGKSSKALANGALMGPSGVRVPVKGQELEIPVAMNLGQIRLWKTSFLEAVALAANAGFSLVEFHAAHGYGLNQFLSPVTNQRNDDYGGSLENRNRLLAEILSEASARHPHLLFSVRIPGQDHLSGGLSAEEGIELAKSLEEAGADLIHVSSGLGGWRRPGPRTGEGYLVEEAERIAPHVNVPVIGVGGIETGAYIDESLQKERFSLAAVGRAILKDPRAWGRAQLQDWPLGMKRETTSATMLNTTATTPTR